MAGVAAMAKLPARHDIEIADFAMLRQARWREAIASTFDRPALLPFLGHLDRIEVHYAARDGAPGSANVVRPMYHVAWLASRLDMAVEEPFRPGAAPWSGYTGLLRHGRRRVPVALRPMESEAPRGTTLIVQLHATRNRAQLWVEVTAQADGVVVQASLNGKPMPERRFLAPRKREADLLAETIETAGRDPLAAAVLATAARLVE
jgi:glucose-6-phosphate dehydrogenase assembly protein OpcA